MRVLVIEDYAPIRESVSRGLREAGFVVDAAPDGRQGQCYTESNAYDVIVLDLMLPELSGLEILGKLRTRRDPASVIILTARDQIDDRVEGLNCGADDYLVKPFAFEELLARVRTLVRRKYCIRDPLIHVDDLVIDTRDRTVKRGERTIELTRREYALLEYLAAREGQVVTRAEIWQHVYDGQTGGQSNVVDVYIGYLRRKIEAPNLPKILHTRRGHGYVLGSGLNS